MPSFICKSSIFTRSPSCVYTLVPSHTHPDIKGTNLHFPLFPPAKDGIAAFHIGIHFPLPASSNKNISGVKAAAFCDPLFVVPPSRLTTVNSPNL